MKLVLLSTDLMMISRIDGAARRYQLSTVTANNQQTAIKEVETDNCCAVLVDLQVSGLNITQLVSSIRNASPDVNILAYGPHVHEDKLAAARDAGCDKVLSRGQFDRELNELMESLPNRR